MYAYGILTCVWCVYSMSVHMSCIHRFRYTPIFEQPVTHRYVSWYLTCAIPTATQIQYMWSGRVHFHNSCTSLCFWHPVIPHPSSDVYICNHHHKQCVRLRFHPPYHIWVTFVMWDLMQPLVWKGCIIHIQAPVYELVCTHVIYQRVMLTHMYKFPMVYDTIPQWLHQWDISMLHQYTRMCIIPEQSSTTLAVITWYIII